MVKQILSLKSIFMVFDVAGIGMWIASSGSLRILGITLAVVSTLSLLYHGRRFVKVWWDILRDQRKIPKASLHLFLQEVWLIPRQSRITVSCGVVSCLLKDIELEHTKLVMQIPLVTEKVEAPIELNKDIPYSGRVKKLVETTILKSNSVALRPDEGAALDSLYQSGERRLDMTAQLIGVIKGRDSEAVELCRSTHFTAYILGKDENEV